MYTHVFAAGTFDGMHKGHEALLDRAFLDGERVIIGLTSDDFIRKFKLASREASSEARSRSARGSGSARQLAKFSTRKMQLAQWLRQRGRQATIIAIDDVHEPAASMPELDAIVVSSKTAFRAREINDIRKKRGLSQLAVLEVPMIDAEDKKPVSSSRMRNGEIDQDGKLILPDNMRPELAKPLGMVLGESEIANSLVSNREKIIVAVGDVATKTLLDSGVTPRLAIIDFRVGRKSSSILEKYRDSLVKKSLSVKSGPGYISKEALQAIRAKHKEKRVIIVDGEEDLLALPAILYAPRGSVVYYGQPREGLVEVMVTDEKKKEVVALLERFT